jgi:uncharacterized protein YegP (UPF0339 family)
LDFYQDLAMRNANAKTILSFLLYGHEGSPGTAIKKVKKTFSTQQNLFYRFVEEPK